MHYTVRLAGLLLGLLGGTFAGGSAAMAQTERGVGWWSGGVGWQQTNTDLFQVTNGRTDLSLSLTQGTFVRNNLLVGASLGFTRSREDNRQGFNLDASTDNRQATFAATPFVRWFWGKDALRGYVGSGLAVGYTNSRLLTTNTQQRVSEQTGTDWQLAPEFQAGLLYTLTPNWGLEVSTRSALLPLAFSSINLGLVVLTGTSTRRAPVESTAAPTQFQKGNWLFGGTFDLGSQQQQTTSTDARLTTIQQQTVREVTVSPSVGYLLGRRWVVGVAVPLQQRELVNQFNRSATDTQTGKVLVKSIGVEPFAKKYLTQRRFSPYVAGRVGWRREEIAGNGSTQSRTTGYTWRLSGGLAYALGTHFLIEGELGSLGHDWTTDDINGDQQRQTNVSLSLRPALTLAYVLL